MGDNKVIVRDVDNLARIRIFVSQTNATVYVTDSQGLNDLSQNGHTTRIVGLPKTDVFSFEDSTNVTEGQTIDWSSLKSWK